MAVNNDDVAFCDCGLSSMFPAPPNLKPKETELGTVWGSKLSLFHRKTRDITRWPTWLWTFYLLHTGCRVISIPRDGWFKEIRPGLYCRSRFSLAQVRPWGDKIIPEAWLDRKEKLTLTWTLKCWIISNKNTNWTALEVNRMLWFLDCVP